MDPINLLAALQSDDGSLSVEVIVSILSSGLVLAIVGGIAGYGRLQQRVESNERATAEQVKSIVSHIQRLDDRIADLTDYLLRQNDGKSIR